MNSPVVEVKEILDVVSTVILGCDVTDEAVVGPAVWLIWVG